MPYTKQDFPKKLNTMPVHCREIWIAAFNSALSQYDDDETMANKVAYAAIKKAGYEKKDDKWVLTKTELYILPLGQAETIELEGGNLFKKKLIEVGEWIDPRNTKKKLKITADRLKSWVDKFKQNYAKVFIPNRHSLDPKDNTGWLKSLEIKDKALFGTLSLSDDTAKDIKDSKIEDISIGIHPDFVDGKGKKWGEVIEHVALTLIPLIKEQSEGEDGAFVPLEIEGREVICMERVEEDLTINFEFAISEEKWSLTDNEIADLPDWAFAIIRTEYGTNEVKKKIREFPHHNKKGETVAEAVKTHLITIILQMGSGRDNYYYQQDGISHLMAHYQDLGKPSLKINLDFNKLEGGEKIMAEKEKEVQKEKEERGLTELERQQIKDAQGKVVLLESEISSLRDYRERKEVEEIDRKMQVLLETAKITPAIKDRLRGVILASRTSKIELEGKQKPMTEEILSILAELPTQVDIGEYTKTELERPGFDKIDADAESDRIMKGEEPK